MTIQTQLETGRTVPVAPANSAQQGRWLVYGVGKARIRLIFEGEPVSPDVEQQGRLGLSFYESALYDASVSDRYCVLVDATQEDVADVVSVDSSALFYTAAPEGVCETNEAEAAE